MTCKLNSMTEDDALMILSWRNHPDIAKFMLTQNEILVEEHLLWYQNAHKNTNNHLLIASENGQPFGFMNLRVTPEHRRAEWGFYTSPGAPKGCGTKMAKATIAYAFDELKLNKLYGQVLPFNTSSISLHNKLGFKNEGVLQQHVFVNNTWYDLVNFGLLSSTL
jgi:UDP-4-amino-4,6-dideoxy-N-acetyl-beta-L-altrosamine N-acetyltransferase